jgi:hypothetical protein
MHSIEQPQREGMTMTNTVPAGYWQSTKGARLQKEAASTVARCISSALKITYSNAYRRVVNAEGTRAVIRAGTVSYQFIAA